MRAANQGRAFQDADIHLQHWVKWALGTWCLHRWAQGFSKFPHILMNLSCDRCVLDLGRQNKERGFYGLVGIWFIIGYVVYLLFLKKSFFLMWTIFKVFIEFITVSLLSYVLVFLATRHVGSQLPDQDWNCTSCIGKWSINPWITREVPIYLLFMPTLPTTERSVFSHPLHKCENQELLVSGSRCLLRRPCPLVAPPSLPQGENQEIPVSKVWVIDTESVTSPSHKYPLVLLFISVTSAKYLLGAI